VGVALFFYFRNQTDCFINILQELNITRQIKIALKFIKQEEVIMRKSQFSKALTIALSPDHFEQIKQITDDQQISMAEWVRDAIDMALKNEGGGAIEIPDR
jgi:predicted HicB family RNase H-like nuclease